MAEPTQLVYTDNPGDAPATFRLPPTLDLVVSSIVARWNGAGAAGPFLPCLSVYSQDDRLVGRFHPETQLAVGDTGVVTYAPFLRPRVTQLSSRSIGALLTRSLADPVSIASGFAPSILPWSVVEFDSGGWFNPLQPSRLTIPAAGRYCVTGAGSFVTNGAGDRHCSIIRSGASTSAVSASPAPASFFWAGSVVLVDEFAAGDYVQLRVAQDSGGNLDTADMFFSAFAIGTA